MATQFFFEAFLDDDETRSLFHQFLTECRTEEPLRFIESVEKFQITKSEINRYSSALKIISTFIDVGSEYEINISETARNYIQAEFTKITPTSCSRLFFDKTLNEVLLELKQDTFKRFLSSSIWTKFLHHKQVEFGDEDKFEDYVSHLTVYDPSIFSSHAALAPEKETPRHKYEDEELLDDILSKISAPYTGIQLRDVRVGFKVYPTSFRGKEIITWLSSYLQSTRDEAVVAARYLQRKKHVFERVDSKKSNTASFSIGEIGDDERVFKFVAAKKVVVIGGGIGGTAVARMLEEYVNVTVIDTQPNLLLSFQNIFLLSDPSKLSDLRIERHSCLTKSRIIEGRAVDINTKERQVLVERNNIVESIPYNAVIIATGVHGHATFPIEVKENCAVIHSYDSDSVIRGHNALRVAKKVIVVGGGLYGVEFACEIAQVFPNSTVMLISRDKALFVGCDEQTVVSEAISSRIKKIKNIQFIHGNVNSANGRIITYTSENISHTSETDVLVVATGHKPNIDVMLKSFSGSLDDSDHIKVNSRFQVLCSDNHEEDTDTSASTATQTSDVTSSTNSDSDAKYYKNIFAIGSVCSISEQYRFALMTIHQALRVCRLLRAIESSEDIKSIAGWSFNKEPLNISLGVDRALVIMSKDKIAMNNKLARRERAIYTLNVHKLLSGPSKRSLRVAYELGYNFNQDKEEIKSVH